MADINSSSVVRDALSALHSAPSQDVRTLRGIRQQISRRLIRASPRQVLSIAGELIEHGPRWVGYELINKHRPTLVSLDLAQVERLGAGNSSWGQVDAFGTLIAGPVWLIGQIDDHAVLAWAERPDRWWRRTALVATTVLNTRSRGGAGDTRRTLAIVERLVRDRDDMVVKAVSWALRSLAPWDPQAVSRVLSEHDAVLAARVKRDVRNKLATGLKKPRAGTTSNDRAGS